MLRDKPLHNFLFETDESGFYSNLDTYCTPWIDVCCLIHLIRRRKPKTLLEIGTHKGYTTRIIANKFPDILITTVDPGDSIPDSDRPSNQKGEYLRQEEIGMLVSGRKNVDIVKKPFGEIKWGDRKFDFIFIDGNHSLKCVLDDSRMALSMISRPGVIVWHDFNNVQDVNKALSQLATPSDIVSIHNTWIAYHDTH